MSGYSNWYVPVARSSGSWLSRKGSVLPAPPTAAISNAPADGTVGLRTNTATATASIRKTKLSVPIPLAMIGSAGSGTSVISSDRDSVPRRMSTPMESPTAAPSRIAVGSSSVLAHASRGRPSIATTTSPVWSGPVAPGTTSTSMPSTRMPCRDVGTAAPVVGLESRTQVASTDAPAITSATTRTIADALRPEPRALPSSFGARNHARS